MPSGNLSRRKPLPPPLLVFTAQGQMVPPAALGTLPIAASQPSWSPLPGPQTLAFNSQADELFFGGAAGGGKSFLLLGLSLTAHLKTLFLRRESVQLTAIIESVKTLVGARGAWRSSGHGGTMRIDGRVIEFVGCEHEDDKSKFQGRDHSLKAFDELPHFTRSQYRFIIGWNRTDVPGERCRVVAAGNPPTTPEGRWVVEEWAPWLDETFSDPAVPGELRWYTYLDGELTWFRSGESIQHKGETITPRSRTFIPARVQDNPIYMQTGYMATLQAMPEPLRSQMLYGDFTAGAEDNAWQVIPTAWVRLAQDRWRASGGKPPEGQLLSCLGVDVAHGGADATVVSARCGAWFAPLKKYRGEITDSGVKAAYLVMQEHSGLARVLVDAIGYGAACHEALREKIAHLSVAVNVARSSEMRDRSGKYRLTNVRAALYWKLREALDPETGDNLALPPDPELLADLTAPRFEVRASGIVVEAKEKLKARIGRSPDCGDAVSLTFSGLGMWEVGGSAPAAPRGEVEPTLKFGGDQREKSRFFGRQ